MPQDIDVVAKRIAAGKCPVCGEDVVNGVSVIDVKLGDLSICEKHMHKPTLQ